MVLTDQSHLGQVKRGRCHSVEIRFCRAPYTDPGAPSREREHCPVCHEAGTRSEVPPAPQSNRHCALASSHTPVHLWWVELRPPSISQHAVPDTQRAGTKELFCFCLVLCSFTKLSGAKKLTGVLVCTLQVTKSCKGFVYVVKLY